MNQQDVLADKTICKKHNQVELYMNPDKNDPNKKFACQICIEKYNKLIPIQVIKDAQNQLLQNFEVQHNKNSFVLSEIRLQLIDFKEGSFIKQISSTIEKVNLLEQSILDGGEKFKSHLQFNIGIEKDEIRQKQQELIQIYKQLDNSIQQFIEQQYKSIDSLKQSLQNLNLTCFELPLNNDIDPAPITSPEQYQIVQEQTIRQEEQCFVLAFNYDATFVIAGCNEKIKVFDYQQKSLNEIQILPGHKDKISVLQFMGFGNQFISGSNDNKIKIWLLNNQKEWINTHTLEGHTDCINCITINTDQNLIVSGSDDKHLKFWKLLNDDWILQQTKDCQIYIYSVGFNDSNKRLGCQGQQQIKIFEEKQNQWVLFQVIEVNEEGFRFCFISESELAIQIKQLVCLFELKNQFEKVGQIELKYKNRDYPYFPMQYIKSKNLLIVKYSNYLNILYKKTKTLVELQSIDFGTQNLFGCTSNDGAIFLTWDQASKQFQIRKLIQSQ